MRIDPRTFRPKNIPGFIVLEGVNGAGKSTIQNSIKSYLQKLDASVVVTREPGGTDLGKTVRKLLQESPELHLNSMSEVFLFAADRREHVEKVIRPSLKAGSWVVTDRYFYSTLAFQGYGRALDRNVVNSLMELAIDGMRPDLVILIDLDPEIGLMRISSRSDSKNATDTFETESVDFHHRIREGFLTIADTSPDPFLVVDGSKAQGEVWASIEEVMKRWTGQS